MMLLLLPPDITRRFMPAALSPMMMAMPLEDAAAD